MKKKTPTKKKKTGKRRARAKPTIEAPPVDAPDGADVAALGDPPAVPVADVEPKQPIPIQRNRRPWRIVACDGGRSLGRLVRVGKSLSACEYYSSRFRLHRAGFVEGTDYMVQNRERLKWNVMLITDPLWEVLAAKKPSRST